VIICWET